MYLCVSLTIYIYSRKIQLQLIWITNFKTKIKFFLTKNLVKMFLFLNFQSKLLY